MSAEVVTVDADTDLRDVIDALLEQRIGAVPGVLAEHDEIRPRGAGARAIAATSGRPAWPVSISSREVRARSPRTNGRGPKVRSIHVSSG